MKDSEIFDEIKIRSLTSVLRDRVTTLRLGKEPCAATMKSALDPRVPETNTLRLIRREARKMYQELEAEQYRERPLPNGIGFTMSLHEELAMLAGA